MVCCCPFRIQNGHCLKVNKCFLNSSQLKIHICLYVCTGSSGLALCDPWLSSVCMCMFVCMHSRYPPAPADAAESESDSGSGDSRQRGVHQTCGATSRADWRQWVCVCRYLCVMSGSGTPAYLSYTWKAFSSQNTYVKDISGSGSIYGSLLIESADGCILVLLWGLAPGNTTQPFISFEDWATCCSCCVAIKNLPHKPHVVKSALMWIRGHGKHYKVPSMYSYLSLLRVTPPISCHPAFSHTLFRLHVCYGIEMVSWSGSSWFLVFFLRSWVASWGPTLQPSCLRFWFRCGDWSRRAQKHIRRWEKQNSQMGAVELTVAGDMAQYESKKRFVPDPHL